jgi:hypothetical protein
VPDNCRPFCQMPPSFSTLLVAISATSVTGLLFIGPTSCSGAFENLERYYDDLPSTSPNPFSSRLLFWPSSLI